ncbi:MAG: hypothetical protein HOP33_06830 [Verrucomicrobia bacterium]|nr:hypothetical protein [Verrucomicrobiota bacterium]
MKPSTPRTKLQPHQCILLFAVSLFVSCGDQSITNKPASSSTPPAAEIPQAPRTYSDKNGYFAAFPPSGWIQKDFPSETIRSKVEFIEPKRADVNIRVIVGPTTTPSVSAG